MNLVVSALAGILAASILLVLLRRQQEKDERRVLAVALAVAAAIYAAFSMNAGPGGWVLVELAGVGIFSLAAWLGYRKSDLILASGWIAHVLWDAGHHVAEGIRFVPEWYPMLCITFDVVIAGYLAYRATHVGSVVVSGAKR